MPCHRDERGDGYADGFQQDCHSERHYDNPDLSGSSITGATASQGDGEWTLNFTVTDDAAKRVHDFTQQHVGRNLALVVDGKVRGTPRIASAIIGNRYRISGLNRADAERMATAISTGCRP